MVWASRQELKTAKPAAELKTSAFASNKVEPAVTTSATQDKNLSPLKPLQAKAGVFQNLKNPGASLGFERLTFSRKDLVAQLPKLEGGPKFSLLGNNLNVLDRAANFIVRVFRQLYLALIAFLTRKFRPTVQVKINTPQVSPLDAKLDPKKKKQEELEAALRSGPSGV